MSIDTEIKGDPDSISNTATWLSGSLRSGITGAATSAQGVTRIPDWSGATAASVTGWASQAAAAAQQVATAATTVASTLDTFATALRQAQREMKRICGEAAAADLDVAGFVIADPGAGPGKPSPLPQGSGGLKISARSRGQHAAAQAAWEEHQRKVKAYQKAEREAEAVRRRIDGAAAALSSGGADTLGLSLKIAGGALNTFKGYASEKTAALLRANREAFDHHWDRQVNHHDPFAQRYMDRNLDARRQLLEGADRLGKVVRPMGWVLDGAGLAKDIGEGKPAEDIIGSKIGGVLGGIGGGALGGFLSGGNPLGIGAGGAAGGAAGEALGEKVAGPVVDAAGYAWDHPLVAAPLAPGLAGTKFALDHVDDVADVASQAPGAVADVAKRVPVLGGGLRKLGL